MVKSVSGLVFGILLLVFSGWGLVTNVIGLFAIAALGAFREGFEAFGMAALPPDWYLYSVGLYSIIISIVGIVLGIGLLMTREWARKASVILSIVVPSIGVLNIVVLAIMGLFVQVFGALFGFILSLIFYGLMLFFFTRPNVKQEFA